MLLQSYDVALSQRTSHNSTPQILHEVGRKAEMKTMLNPILLTFIALFCSRAVVTSHEVVTSSVLRGTTFLEKHDNDVHISITMNTDGQQHAEPEQLQVLQSGVGISDEVLSSITRLKLTREFRYFVYEIKGMMIVIAKNGERSMTYDDFVKELPENDCRYGLIDIEFEADDGRSTSKVVLISWVPDLASVKTRMLYTSSIAPLQHELIGLTIRASDPSDLDFESSILPLLKKKSNV